MTQTCFNIYLLDRWLLMKDNKNTGRRTVAFKNSFSDKQLFIHPKRQESDRTFLRFWQKRSPNHWRLAQKKKKKKAFSESILSSLRSCMFSPLMNNTPFLSKVQAGTLAANFKLLPRNMAPSLSLFRQGSGPTVCLFPPPPLPGDCVLTLL